MGKLPYTEQQGKKLVSNGHLTQTTFDKIKKSGGFMQGLDEGGVVQPEAPVSNPSSDVLNQKAAYYQQQSPGLSLGDALAKAALDVQGVQNSAAQADLTPQQAYEQSMATLPKTAAQAAGNSPAPEPERALSGMSSPSGEMSAQASQGVPVGSVVGGGARPPDAGPMPVPGADYMSQVNKGMQDQLQGTQKLGQAQAGAAAQSSKLMQGIAGEMARGDSIEKIHEMDRQQAAQDGIEKLTKMSADIQSMKVDPAHFWASRSTPQKIAAAIGIALGGLGQGLMKSNHNAAMDVINQAIDRDIDAQKVNISNKRSGLELASSLYGLSQKNFQDERQARLAARSMGLQTAQMQLNAMAAKNQSPEIQAQYQALTGKIETEQAQTRQQLAFQGYQMRAVNQVMGAGGGQVNPEALPKEYRERYVPGVGLTRDPETRRKVDEFRGADDAFKKDLSDLKEFAVANRGTTMDRETVNKGKAMAAALQNSYRKAESMGVYKESEAEFMKHLIGDDPTTWMNYVPQLDALGQSAKNARESFYHAHVSGYQPIREGAPVGR